MQRKLNAIYCRLENEHDGSELYRAVINNNIAQIKSYLQRKPKAVNYTWHGTPLITVAATSILSPSIESSIKNANFFSQPYTNNLTVDATAKKAPSESDVSFAALKYLLSLPMLDINAIDEFGETVLARVVRNQFADNKENCAIIVELLLRNPFINVNTCGISVKEDYTTKTAYDLAIEHNHIKAAELIKAKTPKLTVSMPTTLALSTTEPTASSQATSALSHAFTPAAITPPFFNVVLPVFTFPKCPTPQPSFQFAPPAHNQSTQNENIRPAAAVKPFVPSNESLPTITVPSTTQAGYQFFSIKPESRFQFVPRSDNDNNRQKETISTTEKTINMKSQHTAFISEANSKTSRLNQIDKDVIAIVSAYIKG